jgi:hypothetical protein
MCPSHIAHLQFQGHELTLFKENRNLLEVLVLIQTSLSTDSLASMCIKLIYYAMNLVVTAIVRTTVDRGRQWQFWGPVVPCLKGAIWREASQKIGQKRPFRGPNSMINGPRRRFVPLLPWGMPTYNHPYFGLPQIFDPLVMGKKPHNGHMCTIFAVPRIWLCHGKSAELPCFNPLRTTRDVEFIDQN